MEPQEMGWSGQGEEAPEGAPEMRGGEGKIREIGSGAETLLCYPVAPG